MYTLDTESILGFIFRQADMIKNLMLLDTYSILVLVFLLRDFKEMEPYWASIAKKRMKELGITQSDLLDVFGVTTRGAVGHYFSGRSAINVDQLEALSQKLEMRINYFPDSSGSVSVDDLEKVLDIWLPRLAQVGLVEYKAEVSSIKKLLMSSFEDEANGLDEQKEA